MDKIGTSRGFSRRALVSTLAAIPILPELLYPNAAQAQAPTAPLASWNDGPAKQAVLNFVRATTDRTSTSFVAPEERIATFDQDGTLWVEHPMYTFMTYALERVPVLAKAKPGLKEVEPFKTVLSGNREAMAQLTTADFEKIFAARRSTKNSSRRQSTSSTGQTGTKSPFSFGSTRPACTSGPT
jgi:hypothetical protein